METLPDSQAVAADAVRAQLERILAADAFASAGRISRLLRYVVERTLAGEGPQLKEYVLGVDVFDRDEGYDPRLDSIVRVEVRRLRAKLDEYYRRSGAADPVVITIPRGAYAPLFTPAAPVPAAEPPVVDPPPLPRPDPPARPARPGRSLVAAGVLSVVVLVLVVGTLVSRRAASPAEAAMVRSIVVLPFEHYSTEAAHAMTAGRLTDSVTVELARLGTVSVVSRTTASQYPVGSRSAREIARALGSDFIMESTVRIEHDRVTVVARLVSGELDRKIWVGEHTGPAGDIDALARRIAAEAAAAALAHEPAHQVRRPGSRTSSQLSAVSFQS